MQTLKNHNLKSYTSFGIDALANEFVVVTTLTELKEALQLPIYPKLILGGGSNLLFCENYDGLVIRICLVGIEVKETDDYIYVEAAAGENWHDFVKWTLEQGYPGLENLALIPGVVGAAPVQNIGAYGVEIKDVCDYVDVLNIDTLQVQRFQLSECEFGYRDSIFKQALHNKVVIVSVGFKLARDWTAIANYGPLAELGIDASASAIFERVCEIRSSKLPDPKVLGNAGSFFKNPVIKRHEFEIIQQNYPHIPHYPAGDDIKLAAGWLIEQCELKGYQIGGAQVHLQQALVIVNTGGAVASDIIALALHVQKSVVARFNVQLEHEVRFIGAKEETTLAEVVNG